MPFDATNGDVEDFFRDCAVSSVRIVEDKMDQKPKGFAYVEFRTLDGIKKALDLNGSQFMGRNIRISVAEPRELILPFSTDIPTILTLIALQKKTEPSHRATSATGLEKAHFRTHLELGRDLKEVALDLTVATVDHLEASIMFLTLEVSVEVAVVASNRLVTEKCETLVTGTVKAH